MSDYLPPSFFVIGERKCATSSLYRYLMEHPQILPCKIKEPQFFSRPGWYRLLNFRTYRALFPKINDTNPVEVTWFVLEGKDVKKTTLHITRPAGERCISGEASANYFAQADPRVLRKYYPAAKLIVCLRNPVDRAFSHYRMLQRFAGEGRRMSFRPRDLLQDIASELEAIRSAKQSYFVGQGNYLSNLLKWESVFPVEQMHIIRSEDLRHAERANAVMRDLCTYLGVRAFDFSSILTEYFNVSNFRQVPAEAKAILEEYYKPGVRKLEEHLDRKMDWF